MSTQPPSPVRAPAVLVIGECLVDLAPTASASALPAGQHGRGYVALPGCGPANIAVGLARLGARSSFGGRFSQTGFGPWLRENLSSNGVDLSTSVTAAEPATLAVVTLDDEGKASYAFYGPETADWHWQLEELPAPGLVTSDEVGYDAVQVGSLATAFEPGAGVIATWLDQLRATGRVVVSFDPNVRAGLVADLDGYRSKVEAFVRRSHLVKASEDDFDVLYPGEALSDVAARWLGEGVSVVVVTRGADGAVAYLPDGRSTGAAPPRVEVVDTIGAGDTFSAAFLDFLGRRGRLAPAALATVDLDLLREALHVAVTAAAITCTRAGANPPTATELAAFDAS